MSDTVIEAGELTRTYQAGQGVFRDPAQLRAVNQICFAVEAGRTLAVAGESGALGENDAEAARRGLIVATLYAPDMRLASVPC